MGTLTATETLEQDAAINFRNTLIRIIRASLGLPETVAMPMADELAKGLANEMGGLYITKREIRSVRDEAVRRNRRHRRGAEGEQRHDERQFRGFHDRPVRGAAYRPAGGRDGN